jgi:hypothetical protein
MNLSQFSMNLNRSFYQTIQLVESPSQAVGRLKKHDRAGLPFELLEPLTPRSARRWRESHEHELRVAESSDRQGGRDGAGTRDRHDRYLSISGRLDETSPGIGNCRCASVRHERDAFASSQPLEETRCLANFVVLTQADDRLMHVVVGEELGRAPGVLGGDEVRFPQDAERPKRQIFEVSDRRGDDI